VVIGSPVNFYEDKDAEGAAEKTAKYVSDEIKRLAETLPPHKVYGYATYPKSLKSIENIRKYFNPGEELKYIKLLESRKCKLAD
jgi:hypothetical protein